MHRRRIEVGARFERSSAIAHVCSALTWNANIKRLAARDGLQCNKCNMLQHFNLWPGLSQADTSVIGILNPLTPSDLSLTVSFTSIVGRMRVIFGFTVWKRFRPCLSRPCRLCKCPGRYRKVRQTPYLLYITTINSLKR